MPGRPNRAKKEAFGMKIKNIKSIKDYGVFSDYSNASVKDFGECNIIFGWNYSGKTTLSRIFRSLELKRNANGYESGKFKIHLDDDSEIDETAIESNNLKIKVFNSDYIRDNLKWEQSTRGISPILIVGEESIKLRERLSELNTEFQTQTAEIQKLSYKKGSINEFLESSLTAEARRISQELGIARDFRRPDLEAIVKSSQIKEYLRDEAGFAILKKTALSTAKLGPISEIEIEASKNVGISVKELLKKTVTPSKTIERLKTNKDLESWVRTGRPLHSGKTKCEFCGNELPSNLLAQLDAHFSLEYESFRKEVEGFLRNIENSALDVSSKLKSQNDFYIELQKEYSEAKETINKAVITYNDTLKAIVQLVKAKLDNLATPIDAATVDSFDTAAIDKAVKQFNAVIQKNEERTKNFEKVKKAAVEDLKRHYACQLHSRIKYDENLTEIKELEAAAEVKTKRQTEIRAEIRSIEDKISELVKGSEVLNDYIKRYFGTASAIEIRVLDNQFHVYRDNNVAENLSEGEKTAISFAYFVTTLHAKDTKDVLHESIVWVDDPISSLDHNHLYNTFSLISGCLKEKCEQVFISTHNYEFFNLLKDDLMWKRLYQDRNKCNKRENNKCKANIYQINRTHKNSVLNNIDCLLCRYKTEYQYIFYQLNEFTIATGDADEYKRFTIPNMLRRFLETYIGFASPSVMPWGNNLHHLLNLDDDRKFVYRLVNEMSHNENTERTFKLYNTEEIRRAIHITFEAFQTDSTKAQYIKSLRESVGIAA
jgi:wobble nucleotide-excising tRNase